MARPRRAALAPLVLVGALALLASFGLSGVARAQVSDATRNEARERFDRGLRLFNQQDNEGALAEFHRAYELSPHPLVLYNIGLVLAAAGKPVLAVDTFDQLLQSPAGLSAEQVARARAERTTQITRIGDIAVQVNVDGATVELDGLEVGHAPMKEPIRAATGTHVVGVTAPGHAPLRKPVSVAGQTQQKLDFELLPLEGQLAHLVVKTRLPDAEVLVDGQVVGRTPIATSLSLAPGDHALEVRRPGYRSAAASLTLGAGSTGSLELEPVLDPAQLALEGGRLELGISEPAAVVWLDGERSTQGTGLALPRGKHLLRVERDGFYPFERSVDVPRGAMSRVGVELEPTPETRASYRSRTLAQRTWGWVGIGAGLTVSAGSTAFLFLNNSSEQDKKDAFETEADRNREGGECDPAAGMQTRSCQAALKTALDELDAVRAREKFGWIGLGVGAAMMGTGAILLLTGDDPDRYELRPESDVFGGTVTPAGWLDPAGGGGLSIQGSF